MYGIIPIANTENCCNAPPANVLNIPNKPAAVSYTHLDVYKRQTLYCKLQYEEQILKI